MSTKDHQPKYIKEKKGTVKLCIAQLAGKRKMSPNGEFLPVGHTVVYRKFLRGRAGGLGTWGGRQGMGRLSNFLSTETIEKGVVFG